LFIIWINIKILAQTDSCTIAIWNLFAWL